MIAVLAGCPPKAPPIDLTEPPRLPSPQSGTYGRLQTRSADAVVDDVVGEHRWDAYLSGGATSLALDTAKGAGTLSPWDLREDVWRAGYPYPLEDVRVFLGKPEQPPPAEVITWVAGVDPTADLGLVRARSVVHEAWVGLTAKPRFDLGVLPRAIDRGDTFTLPAVPGGRYAIANADGEFISGPLDGGWTKHLEAQGEWVFQVYDEAGLVAWFPVYVGIAPPLENLFPAAATPLGSDAEVADQVERYLAFLRGAYGAGVWRRDVILDASARRLLGDPEASAGAVLRGLGVAEPHQSWSCNTSSIEACLDPIVWDPSQRRAFISPEFTHLGIATAVDGSKVRIRIVLSGG